MAKKKKNKMQPHVDSQKDLLQQYNNNEIAVCYWLC